MKLSARRTFSYGGIRYVPGDTVYMTERHAKVFLALGKVKEATEEQAEVPTADVQIEPENNEAPEELEPKRKRTYKRRDMTASEE